MLVNKYNNSKGDNKTILYPLKPCFLAHTSPDDDSASDMSKENTLGNVLKVTKQYPAPDLGKGGEWIE